MDLTNTWRSLYTLRYIPITIIQVVFAAGTIFILLAIQATSGLRVAKESLRHYLSQAELCVQYLNEMGQSWKCASDIADILKKLLQQQLKPVLEKKLAQSSKKHGKEVEAKTPSTVSVPTSHPVPYPGYQLPSTAYASPPRTPANDSWFSYGDGHTGSAPSYTSNSSSVYSGQSVSPAEAPLHDFGFPSMETAGFLAMADGEGFSHAPFIAPFHTVGLNADDMESHIQQGDENMLWPEETAMTDWQDMDFASLQHYLGGNGNIQ